MTKQLLMIPGPIEFDTKVLSAMSVPTVSHVAPSFINCFSNCISLMKTIFRAPKGQAFIVSGSGTLAMDMAGANLVENGDDVLVISTGYFGERFKTILDRYGANSTILQSEIGGVVSLEAIEKELQSKPYKLLTFTHVDTSTGVRVNPKPIAALCKKYDTLCILDGVCSVAAEEIAQDEWGIDVVVTASQKAIGVPPGLALLMVSPKAMLVWENRKSLVANYYSDFANWLPIMKAYEEKRPSYFGTPPVNLILALEVSLKQIQEEGMQKRFERHRFLAEAFVAAVESIGLELVCKDNKNAAFTLSAVRYPQGVQPVDFLGAVSSRNVIVAGGLHPAIKQEYFRVGHMGIISSSDLIAVLSAIEYSLSKNGYDFESGKALKTFQDILNQDN